MVTAPLGAGFPAEPLNGARSRGRIAGHFSSSVPEVAGETPIAFPRSRTSVDATAGVRTPPPASSPAPWRTSMSDGRAGTLASTW